MTGQSILYRARSMARSVGRIREGLLLAGLLALASPLAAEEDRAPIEDILNSLSSRAGLSCALDKMILESPPSGSAEYELEGARMRILTVCTCIPQRIQEVRASLSPRELKASVSMGEFEQRFRPAILERCAAEQFKAEFSKTCVQPHEGSGTGSPAICDCMLDRISALPDSEVYATAVAAHRDFQAAARARAEGLPVPEKSRWSKRIDDLETFCRAAQ